MTAWECIGALFMLLFASACSGAFVENELADDIVYKDSSVNPRHAKFFPYFTVVRFANTLCEATNSLDGTCFTKKECHDQVGVSSGVCAQGIGVCCVFQRTCAGSSKLNNTYFVNPGFPASYGGGTRCTMTINRMPGICQVRLDFLDLALAQPSGDGVCITDFLSVGGGANPVPRLCGDNTDQHVYVDFDEDEPIVVMVDTMVASTFSRRWNIKIAQIACDSENRAPTGCLQYHRTGSGMVKSFNYGTNQYQGVNSQGFDGTRELANLNYGVCVKPFTGYCGIRWSQDSGDQMAFTVTNDVGSVDPGLLGTGVVQSQTCSTDFVVIPNPMQGNMGLPSDRFCGMGLVPTSTYSRPFVLTVVTDGNEVMDIANRGFSLMYQQLQCPSRYPQ